MKKKEIAHISSWVQRSIKMIGNNFTATPSKSEIISSNNWMQIFVSHFCFTLILSYSKFIEETAFWRWSYGNLWIDTLDDGCWHPNNVYKSNVHGSRSRQYTHAFVVYCRSHRSFHWIDKMTMQERKKKKKKRYKNDMTTANKTR